MNKDIIESEVLVEFEAREETMEELEEIVKLANMDEKTRALYLKSK
jgi:hypothetical protein